VSFDTLLIHRVTLRKMVPAAREARFGNRELTHDPDADVTTRARVDMGASSEVVLDREEQRDTALVFLPASPEVVAFGLTGSDEVYWIDEDVTFRSDGDPIRSYDGLGLHHFELDAFRVRG
jgi:hypothetical protein